jgi:predicted XRE-type DNA-binding protein
MANAQRRTDVEDEDLKVHRGSGDFLADQGIEDPEEFRVLAHLCNEIGTIIERRELTQEQAAALTGQSQPDISRIVNGHLDEISVWRLLKVLSALGADVMIAVNPDGQEERGIIAAVTLDAPEESVAPAMSP